MMVVSVSHLYFRYAPSIWSGFARRPSASWVLQDINLEVSRGEIVAVIGPNGAGKSTLLRLLALLLWPTRGHIRYWGDDSRQAPQALRQQIVWLGSSERSFAWRLTGRQNLHFFAALRGIDARTCERELLELAPALGLEEMLDQRVDRYSHGQKQRLAWARLLLAHPQLFLLDEPFLGLDEAGQAQIWQLLADWGPRQAPPTIIIATPHADPGIFWTQTLTLSTPLAHLTP